MCYLMNGYAFMDWLLGSLLSGLSTALVIWWLAHTGKLPMIISVKMTKEEYSEYLEEEETDEEER